MVLSRKRFVYWNEEIEEILFQEEDTTMTEIFLKPKCCVLNETLFVTFFSVLYPFLEGWSNSSHHEPYTFQKLQWYLVFLSYFFPKKMSGSMIVSTRWEITGEVASV